jgi:DNA-binding SARP family transcriptional activator/TolB-like protein
MIRFSTLGTAEITGSDGTAPEQVLAQPKRLGILAHLALARPYGPQRRDTLLALFWPELEAARARDNLRQALSFLRRSLGPDILVSHGSISVAINEEEILCDAREFDRLLDAGDRGGALALYRGNLLDGFYISGASPEFEHWLDQERTRLKRRACETARILSEEHEARSELEGAVDWARREAEIDPFDEHVLRRLLSLLDRGGNPYGAVAEYDRFARHLDAIFEDTPSAKTQALVEEVRRRWEAVEPEPSLPALENAEHIPAPESPSVDVAGPDAPDADGLDAIAPSADDSALYPPRRFRLYGRSAKIAALIALPLLLWVGVFASGRWPSSESASEDTVAVLPFRVGGADPSLGYLHEGMVDLLAARLDGSVTPRAINSRTMMSAWRRAAGNAGSLRDTEAVDLAERLGAERVLLGEVVGGPGRLILNASLRSVPEGRVLAQSSVQGPVDSLAALVDGLTVRLTLAGTGEAEHRTQSLESVPLPALEAYLRGAARYRLAEYATARTDFERALEVEPTFALAAMGVAATYRFDGAGNEPYKASAAATRLRDHLGKSDRILLDALVSPYYPMPVPYSEQIIRWEKVVHLQPGNAEAWYWLGDLLYHWGPALGLPAARERALGAFQRSVALDSSFVPSIRHLIQVFAEDGNLAMARQLYRHFEALDPVGTRPGLLGAYVEHLLENKSMAATIRSRLAHPIPSDLALVLGAAHLRGTPVSGAQADSIVRVIRSRAATAPEERLTYTMLYYVALNRGRPAEARWSAERLRLLEPGSHDHLRAQMMAALYSDGDARAAEEAARILASIADARIAAGEPPTREDNANVCTTAQWRVRHGSLHAVRKAIGWLRAAPHPSEHPYGVLERRGCADFLAGFVTMVEGDPARAVKLLVPLSQKVQDGILGAWAPAHLPNLVLAEAYERVGEPTRALEALRRRPYHGIFGMEYLSTFLIREARLAEAVGDREGAIRAYRHYLSLRPNPEPSVAREVDRARKQLKQLTRAAATH